jgi:calcium permeable stress-gated cation channel
MTDAKRRSQQMMGWVWLAVVCAFNTLPLLVISVIANLSHIAQYIPFLQKWQTQSEWTFALVNGILPPTISAVFGYFLPKVMRWLSRYQGAITHSRLDRAVVARYFAFLVISQLFIFSLLGVGFNLITQIVNDAQQQKSVWDILKETKGVYRTRLVHPIAETF